MSIYETMCDLANRYDLGTTFRVSKIDGNVTVSVSSECGIFDTEYPHAITGTMGELYNLPDGATVVNWFHNSETVNEPRHFEYCLDHWVEGVIDGSYESFDFELQPVSCDNDDPEFADVEPTIFEGWIMVARENV